MLKTVRCLLRMAKLSRLQSDSPMPLTTFGAVVGRKEAARRNSIRQLSFACCAHRTVAKLSVPGSSKKNICLSDDQVRTGEPRDCVKELGLCRLCTMSLRRQRMERRCVRSV